MEAKLPVSIYRCTSLSCTSLRRYTILPFFIALNTSHACIKFADCCSSIRLATTVLSSRCNPECQLLLWTIPTRLSNATDIWCWRLECLLCKSQRFRSAALPGRKVESDLWCREYGQWLLRKHPAYHSSRISGHVLAGCWERCKGHRCKLNIPGLDTGTGSQVL